MENQRKKSKGHTIESEKIYKLFIYVVLIVLAISIIVPVAWVFLASVKQNSEFYGNPWTLPAGFYYQNFILAFEKAKMGEYFLNSMITTATALLILLVVALPAAYVLARCEFKGNRFFNTMFMAGLFINVNYIVVPIFLMLVSGDTAARNFFGTGIFLNNIFVLALIYASTALPFTIYLLSGYFKTLPKDYEEAAYVDGSGYFRTMVQIIMPMARPSIITVILFNFLSFWNEYIIALTLMTNDAAKTLPVGVMNLMTAQNAAAQYGQMYAGLVIVMLPTLILYIMVQKKLTQGMSMGGLKG
jgi:N-acetylglucosamine transport system permease protein